MSDHIETSLSVALTAARKARYLIEDNHDKDDPTLDGLTLREVYAQLLTVGACLAGAHAAVVQRREMLSAIETADTERSSVVRLVR